MQFHTKLNGFQQLAYLLVMISVILSNTVLFEMGSKNDDIVGYIRNHCNVITNNKHLPYDSSCTAKPYLYS